jgi:hypothetical protein
MFIIGVANLRDAVPLFTDQNVKETSPETEKTRSKAGLP